MKNEKLGAIIRRRRQVAGLTLGQVALKVGVSKTAISKIERGLTEEPGIHTITGIALALDTTPDDLLIEAELLNPPMGDQPWSYPLMVMQRALNLYPPGSEKREHIERIIVAQAEAYVQFKGEEEGNDQDL